MIRVCLNPLEPIDAAIVVVYPETWFLFRNFPKLYSVLLIQYLDSVKRQISLSCGAIRESLASEARSDSQRHYPPLSAWSPVWSTPTTPLYLRRFLFPCLCLYQAPSVRYHGYAPGLLPCPSLPVLLPEGCSFEDVRLCHSGHDR